MPDTNAFSATTRPPGGLQILAVAVLSGAALYTRLLGLWWDGGASLHADERFLIFVLEEMRAALDAESAPLSQWYFDPAVSPLNPHREGRLYAYGEWPVIVLCLLTRALGIEGWGEMQAFGRTVSAVLDASVVPLVFASAWAVVPRFRPAFCAAALYATAPLALQQSVFMTVESWLTAACALCGLFLLNALRASGPDGGAMRAAGWGVAACAAAGLATACKLSGLLLAPAILLALLYIAGRTGRRAAALAAVAGAIAFLAVLRLTSPSLFQGPALLGIAPNPVALGAFQRISELHSNPRFPPNWTWMAGYGAGALLRDAVLFAWGPAITLALCLGAVRFVRGAAPAIGCLAALAAAPFAFTLWADTPILRYLAPAVPPLAVLAGLVLDRYATAIAALVVCFAVFWGSGVVRLHTGTHPRIAATQFLARYPEGTVLANETAWDEGLPAHPWWGRLPGVPERWDLRVLDITGPDTPEKAERLAAVAGEARLIAVTSGRQRQAMTRLPDRFPLTVAWYRGLESGDFCYDRVFHAAPGYPVPGLRLDDAWTQEGWRVFDHPIVSIYERQPCYEQGTVAASLRNALPPGR
ncbi:glycosyltransferase family 39 protein [Psychromarinibacter sp. C21-152]|uniref:Glycosyltransferase family 39 protein n=1 Tax=Psychromarinibacter sediminicola TaxID=3033385 RepID=A0AAE3NYX7_9RHOB|nr:glycosyltransferase family 39 protein [Psychromarinibacter sediminicola]MDF0603257.1 glycosyltransferase family 39 protein [Psychromarinibacter sediminicola]